MDIITLDQTHGIERIPTGILSLDYKIKGLPRGKIIRLHGNPSVGKSTLSYVFAKKAIELGYKILVIDAEASLDKDYIRGLGIDPRSLYIPSTQISTVKKATSTIIKAHKEYNIDIVILDSITALLPVPEEKEIIEALLKGKEVGAGIGAQARQISEQLRILIGYAAEHKITLITIAQRRKKIDPRGFATGEYITGGNAYHFYTHLSMELSAIKELDRIEGDDLIRYVKVKVDKNKTGLPFQETIIKLHIGKGIDDVYDVYQFLLETGIVKASGAWMSIKGSDKKVRKSQLLQYIKDNIDRLKPECEKMLIEPDYMIEIDAQNVSKVSPSVELEEDI